MGKNNAAKIIQGVFKKVEQASKDLSRDQKIEVCQVIVDEMKKMIAVGQSPIEGKGRFEGYRAESATKAARGRREPAKRSSRVSKIVRKIKSIGKRKPVKKSRSARPAQNTGFYPDNVRKKYPNKRRRPVNLFLSGAMMRALSPIIQGTKAFVGYPEGRGKTGGGADASIKEKGHREGVNNQKKRPTIPKGSEKFARRIRQAASSKEAQMILANLRKLTAKSS